MNKFSGNPILPSYEYVPDPEVHVFGDRVYIYGSHDEFNGKMYCDNDYVTWSAPVTDLSQWRYEGYIYKKEDHESPLKKGKTNMYAPDVAKGPDGNYYLYYSIADSSVISVAKSTRPEGPFTYYGDVKNKEGKTYGADLSDYFEFDPAILVDGDRVFLYSGSGQKENAKNGHPIVGLFVRELEKDMVTAKTEPNIVMTADDDRSQPNFFEAASIRKFGEWFYLLYMATDLSGLHYMMSRYPDKDFKHMGLLHSTSYNLSNDGSSTDDAHIIENNHGSIERIDGEYYVFNHRHTNRSHFSRQIVGDKLNMNEDGTFDQAIYTSQGLRGKPFDELGEYPAVMTCGLINRNNPELSPYITQEVLTGSDESIGIVKEIKDSARLTYRYFDLPQAKELVLSVRGNAQGSLTVLQQGDEETDKTTSLHLSSEEWQAVTVKLPQVEEVFSLNIIYNGEGSFDIMSLEFR